MNGGRAAVKKVAIRLGFFAISGALAFASLWYGLHLFFKTDPPTLQVNAIITDCHEVMWTASSAGAGDVYYGFSLVRVCDGAWTVQGRSYQDELAHNGFNGKLASTDTPGKQVEISVLASDPGQVVDPDDRGRIVGTHQKTSTFIDSISRRAFGIFFIILGFFLSFVSLASLSPKF